MESVRALGDTMIPAIISEASESERYLMSLVENLARRQRSPVELLREVTTLKARGYTVADIAEKIDMAKSYIGGICHLLDHGEERLLAAVDKGKLPLSVAMLIANADEAGIQNALCEAYEDQSLRGRKLLTIRKIIEQRTAKGKNFAPGARRRNSAPTAELLVRAYRQEADRQKLLIAKVRLTEHRLVFLISAMKRLLGDENLVNLLRAEGLDSLPSILVDKMKQQSKD
jgi:ParB family chromosome partitioning protein